MLAIINEVGITFLSIFFSFFTSMGITVRVKLKMSWIIIIVMYILIFLNIAFIINEIVKQSIYRNKKKVTDATSEFRGTEGDEQGLKDGRSSP